MLCSKGIEVSKQGCTGGPKGQKACHQLNTFGRLEEEEEEKQVEQKEEEEVKACQALSMQVGL